MFHLSHFFFRIFHIMYLNLMSDNNSEQDCSFFLINYLNNLVFKGTSKLTVGGGLKGEKEKHELLN